jgi:hypothetical protein
MKKVAQLSVRLSDFENDLLNYITEGEGLYKLDVFNFDDFEIFTKKVDKWVYEVGNLIKNSFSDGDNIFFTKYEHLCSYKHINTVAPDLVQNTKHAKRIFYDKIRFLKNIIIDCKIGDLISNPALVNVSKRSNLTIQEKEDFLLDKLYQLRNIQSDSYFSVPYLFLINGVSLDSKDESAGIAQSLSQKDLISVAITKGECDAKISINGVRYIQNKLRQSTTSSALNEEHEELYRKIDSILLRLDKLDENYSIVYNGLEELKKLVPKLNKKEFKQIVLGKFMDFVLNKVLTLENAQTIIENITDSNRLLE